MLSSALSCGGSGRLPSGLTGVVASALSPYPTVPTFPVVGTRSAKVHSVLGEAAAGAQLTHAGLQVVRVTVAHLVVVGLPVIAGVQLQVVAPHIALAHHAPLVLRPRPQHLGVAVGTDLGTPAPTNAHS